MKGENIMDKREDDIIEETEETAGDGGLDVPEEETEEADFYEPDDENINEIPEMPETLRDGSGESTESAKDIEKLAREKAAKVKFTKKIIAVTIAAVLIIGGGLFAFWQIERLSIGYILTFDNEKISIEEFKLYLVMSDGNNPKEEAIERLMDFLIMSKEAKERNIELSQSEIDEIKADIEYSKNFIPLNKLKIKEERLIEIFGLEFLFLKLIDKVAEDSNFVLNEEMFSEEFEHIRSHYHDFKDLDVKYVLTLTREDAEQAREALLVDSSSAEIVIREYSMGYEDESIEIEVLRLSEIEVLNQAHVEHLLSLQVSDISDVISIDGQFYLVFIIEDVIIPTAEEVREVEELYRERYTDYEMYQLFVDEFITWKEESEIKLNEKAYDNFDVDKFFDWFID